MAIAVVFDFAGEDVAKYEKVFEAGGVPVLEQPARSHHLCYRTDDGFVVVDVWDSAEDFEAFGAVIGPATAAAGLHAAPQVYPVQGVITHDGTRTV